MTKETSQQSPEISSQEFPEDYHDYVFRDGKLVGDFDNMYRYSKEIPWHQDKSCDHWDAKAGMLMLREYAPYEHILEVGCGLGYISGKLREFAGEGIDAFDVSPEAIEQANSLHPKINFYVDDITQPSFQPKRQYDLVTIWNVFWYIFEHMETVIHNINACVKPQGWLHIAQFFPALDGPFVGKEIIPNPEALLAYLPNFEPIYSAQLRNHELVKDGPILHFLGRKAK